MQDKDKDKNQAYKDQDKDKDLTHKDKDFIYGYLLQVALAAISTIGMNTN